MLVRKCLLMISKKSGILLCFCFLLISAHQLKAQSNLLFYHENDLFNSSNYNPAFLNPSSKFTLSIFPLAGTSINFNDSQALSKISDILLVDVTHDALKDVLKSMVTRNLFYQHGEVAILNFSYRSKYGSFNFVIKENERLMMDFNGELSKFLMNEASETVTIGHTQEFPAEAIHYREYSLGYATELIKNKLTVGIRGKLYYGKAFMSSNVSAQITEQNGEYFIESSGPLKLSVPASTVKDVNGNLVDLVPFDGYGIDKYLMNTGNFGTGIDLGFTYRIAPSVIFSASATDLGKISWKENLNSMEFDTQHHLQSSDVNSHIADDGSVYLTKKDEEISLVDSITSIFNIAPTTETMITKTLPATFYAGLKYIANPQLSFGIVDRYIKNRQLTYNNLSLTATYKPNKHFTFISGLSAFGRSYVNIPLGTTYHCPGGQAYLGTDNIISLLASSSTGYQGITFGACFYIFRRKVKYEHIEYLPFFKHKKGNHRNGNGLIFKGDL